MGMEGYDPDHGHEFTKQIKERQVRENYGKLEDDWADKRNDYAQPQEYLNTSTDSILDNTKTLYIWRNESFRSRFEPKLGKLKPAHIHTNSQDNIHQPEIQKSMPQVNIASGSIFNESINSIAPEANSPKYSKKRDTEEFVAKSHSMLVQATAQDIISFENICKLSNKYKIDNKIIYELHSEFISIRDMQ